MPLKIKSPVQPKGDQPKAIKKLVEGIEKKDFRYQTLLGVTGSGKTLTMAYVIDAIKKPTLVIGPNKTLVAQLFGEFKLLFPDASVNYYASYYDYYQPEAYLPKKDLYIEKDFDINEEIERLRHSALEALATREDVIIVSTVSCIYGTGSPELYRTKKIFLAVGDTFDRDELFLQLIYNQYQRNDYNLTRKSFRVRGDTIEIFPLYGDHVYRIEFFGDEIERITSRNPVTNEKVKEFETLSIYPATQYLTDDAWFNQAIKQIEKDLAVQLEQFKKEGKIVEYHRLKQRTQYDLELLKETHHCPGIENYSRYFDNRKLGEKPFTLLDHFPEDFLMIIDESHLTIPQLRGMYRGDFSRKKNLVNYGWRLPAAFDNRPLKFKELEEYMRHVIFASATPGPYELEVSQQVVEQIIRPTGLVDPKIELRKTQGQIKDLLTEIRNRVTKNERVIVTTLSKQMAEELSDYLKDMGVKAVYLHHEIETLERVRIIEKLRGGHYDVIVGINLLREGLDLPEVSLVAILDADKEGFLRSKRSLIQLMGRASRNVHGSVILYADKITPSMRDAIMENNRRRQLQLKYNQEHGIKPKTISKRILGIVETLMDVPEEKILPKLEEVRELGSQEIGYIIEDLKQQMVKAAAELNFEQAAVLRDRIKELEKMVSE